MRYRKLDSNGDYVFGHGSQDYYVNQPEAVEQAVKTGLKLFQGQWFLDLNANMPWYTQVVGQGTGSLYDTAIKKQILSTQGVAALVAYSSQLNPPVQPALGQTVASNSRMLKVNALISTVYSETPIAVSAVLPGAGYGIGGYGSLPYGT